jgi:hypothetical protein
MAVTDLLAQPKTIELTGHEIENILQAYYKLKGDNPFFGFNEATFAIIDKLKAAKAR